MTQGRTEMGGTTRIVSIALSVLAILPSTPAAAVKCESRTYVCADTRGGPRTCITLICYDDNGSITSISTVVLRDSGGGTSVKPEVPKATSPMGVQQR
jgi:hypothetical protein